MDDDGSIRKCLRQVTNKHNKPVSKFKAPGTGL